MQGFDRTRHRWRRSQFFHQSVVVPIVAFYWFVESRFYQASDVRKIPTKIDNGKVGKEMLSGAERTLTTADSGNGQNVLQVANLASDGGPKYKAPSEFRLKKIQEL